MERQYLLEKVVLNYAAAGGSSAAAGGSSLVPETFSRVTRAS